MGALVSQLHSTKLGEATAPSTSAVCSLPPEIVGRILELAVEGLDAKPRRFLLRLASSMCRIWSIEARLLLWRDITVREEWQARKVLSSPVLGSYRTTKLTLDGGPSLHKSLSSASAREVCAGLVGIKHLVMVDFVVQCALEMSLLHSPSLKGTKDPLKRNVLL